MRPHRQQPTRLYGPWDSPGKNTGVGCHFPLQGMKVKSESEVAKSCLTLSDPMDCSLPGSSIHGIFQARVLEWGAIAFSVTFIKLSTQLESAVSFRILFDSLQGPSRALISPDSSTCSHLSSVALSKDPGIYQALCCFWSFARGSTASNTLPLCLPG